MLQIFIAEKNRFIFSIHPDIGEIETAYKIVTAKTDKEVEKFSARKFYKLSFWERLKFFGIALHPKIGQQYSIIPLQNGKYKIKKQPKCKTYKIRFWKFEIYVNL